MRRLVYRVANLHDALSHFLVTRRPDLLGRANRELQLALEEAREFL